MILICDTVAIKRVLIWTVWNLSVSVLGVISKWNHCLEDDKFDPWMVHVCLLVCGRFSLDNFTLEGVFEKTFWGKEKNPNGNLMPMNWPLYSSLKMIKYTCQMTSASWQTYSKVMNVRNSKNLEVSYFLSTVSDKIDEVNSYLHKQSVANKV